jgi:hypothetical protein
MTKNKRRGLRKKHNTSFLSRAQRIKKFKKMKKLHSKPNYGNRLTTNILHKR